MGELKQAAGIKVVLQDHYEMPNPLETTCTVLSSIGISPEYSPMAGTTELWINSDDGSSKYVGYLDFIHDLPTGRRNLWGHTDGGKAMQLLTDKDIFEFKDILMAENNIQDNDALEIIVQYQHEDTYRLKAIEKGNWIDMAADEDVTIKAGELKLINLGVAMKLPEGYEGHLAPRSSTLKKFGVLQANSVGVVDDTYCGPTDWWRFPAFATRDTEIKRGERICQFRIMEVQPKLRFTEGKMVAEDRGGFGSTGTK
jgi:dUTP pyrophosphatase